MNDGVDAGPNVLLVGQVYLDTILNVPHFPEEDSKLRATNVITRTGGNACNTAQALTQLHEVVFFMSAVGSRETSNHIVDLLGERTLCELDDTLLFREGATTPFSTIIQNQSAGTRTIISHADLQDITCNEFIEKFEKIRTTTHEPNRWWVHFEGRNIENTLQQIDYLHHKATVEDWRESLTISVELEKPEREKIDYLIGRGDVLFFSKVYAASHGFSESKSFLKEYPLLKKLMKQSAIAYCTWGAGDASVLDNRTGQLESYTPRKVKKVIDSVGAGDTFVAGVISALWESLYTPLNALKFACDLASAKVTFEGLDDLLRDVTLP